MTPTPQPRDFRSAVWERRAAKFGPMLLVVALWISGFHVVAGVLFTAVFCTVAYATLCPTTRLLGPILLRLPQDEGVLITLDDGPHPDSTPDMLDVLDRHQAKAVFFVIGNRVNQWPELVQEMVRRGHVVGNHSQTHPSGRFWLLTAAETWREIADCQTTLQAVLGQPPVWFRAPVGHFNPFTHPALSSLGLRLMGWSSRGFDAVDASIPNVLRRMESGLKPGAILLLHEARPHSAALLDATLRTLKQKGLLTVDPRTLTQANGPKSPGL